MMNGKIWIVVVIAAIFAVLGYMIYSSGPIVSAQGQSSLSVQPDEISVYVTIESKNKTLQEAQKTNSEIREAVVEKLLDMGIDEEDIEFANYNSYPWTEWINGRSVERGYIVNQQIVIKRSEFKKVPRIVDKVIEAGGLISYMNFELSMEKENEYKSKALEMASKNAKEKAEAIASGQGKKVGKLVSVKSDEFNYAPVPYYMAKAEGGSSDSIAEVRSAAASISPQDLEVSATIIAEYKLRGF